MEEFRQKILFFDGLYFQGSNRIKKITHICERKAVAMVREHARWLTMVSKENRPLATLQKKYARPSKENRRRGPSDSFKRERVEGYFFVSDATTYVVAILYASQTKAVCP